IEPDWSLHCPQIVTSPGRVRCGHASWKSGVIYCVVVDVSRYVGPWILLVQRMRLGPSWKSGCVWPAGVVY
ncbi:hypothetical protein LINPERHAP1_LOCUS6139, partial [Linum perenne]